MSDRERDAADAAGDAARVTAQQVLAGLIGALPDPVVITDAYGNVIAQNALADRLLAERADDTEGRRRAVEINHLLFRTFLSKGTTPADGRARPRELNLVDPDVGTDCLFEVLSHRLPVDVAGVDAVMSVLRDVTDLKRASAELERQSQRVRTTEQEATRQRDRLDLVLNNVGDPILVTDESSRIMLMNPQAKRLFELPAGPSEQARIEAVRGNAAKFTTLIADFAPSRESYRRERLTLVHPATGAELPLEIIAGKVINQRGEPMAVVSVLHDLTQQVENEQLYAELKKFSIELEDRIRMATSDLEEQNLRLQWQSSELEKAYRLKSEFLANMSHELRTPINALIGYTALMLDRIYGELTPKQVEGLTRIQASSQHLLLLVNDVLDLAKIEAGRMPVHLELTALRPIILEVAAQIEPLVRKKSLGFRYEASPDLPVMITDRTKVKQIMLNLLSNAVKFTHRGSVSLVAEAADDAVRITVSDTGIGIRPEYRDVIFEEFRQVDQSRTREYGGTGLGLSITRKLIALLDGEITLDSEYGAGTTFVVTLPVRSEPPGPEEYVTRMAFGGVTRPS